MTIGRTRGRFRVRGEGSPDSPEKENTKIVCSRPSDGSEGGTTRFPKTKYFGATVSEWVVSE